MVVMSWRSCHPCTCDAAGLVVLGIVTDPATAQVQECHIIAARWRKRPLIEPVTASNPPTVSLEGQPVLDCMPHCHVVGLHVSFDTASSALEDKAELSGACHAVT